MKEGESQFDRVVSPFADAEAMVTTGRSSRSRIGLIIGIAVVVLIVGGAGGWVAIHNLNDPLRTLEIFPVAKYLDSYKGLAGSHFKGTFSVEADLGWKDGVGRLMLFSSPDDSRPVAVLIPAGVANGNFFQKGQSYQMALEVKEGGLIYASACRKN